MGNMEPRVDAHKDYRFHYTAVVGRYMVMKFSRYLTTCDDDDMEITVSSQYASEKEFQM